MKLEVASDRLHFLSKLGEYSQRLLGTGLCRLVGPDLLYRVLLLSYCPNPELL